MGLQGRSYALPEPEPRRLHEPAPITRAVDEVAGAVLGGRLVAILGAGASDYERFGTRRLCSRALEHLRVSKPDPELPLERIVRRAFGERSPSDCTFEQLLSLYRDPYDLSIHDFLDESGITPKSVATPDPILAYELLAHLVSYDLICDIISFNFDEGLESALDDEIGEQSYEWVYSDSAFHRIAEKGYSSLDKPAIIKPHGTISSPDTICPTVETVRAFPEHKRAVLEAVLAQSSAILILGFSCPDPDFQKVITDLALANPRQIYWVDNRPALPKESYAFQLLTEEAHGRAPTPVFVESNVEDFLLELTRELQKRDSLRCPDVARHLIRCKFHEWGAIPSIDKLFKLEAMIYALKTCGRFSLEGLFQCRRVDSIASRLVASADSKDLRLVLDEIVANGFLVKDSDITATEAYYIPHDCVPEGQVDPDALALLDFEGSEEQRREAFELLRCLRETVGVDFGFGGPRNYLLGRFHSPALIRDHTELHERTKETLTSVRKRVDVVSESGGWLIKDFLAQLEELSKGGTRLNLLLAEPGPEDQWYRDVELEATAELQVLFGGNLSVQYVPWELHDTHMTLSDGGQAVYFSRRYTMTTVSPVHLTTKEDLEIVRGELRRIERMVTRRGKGQKAG